MIHIFIIGGSVILGHVLVLDSSDILDGQHVELLCSRASACLARPRACMPICRRFFARIC